MEAILAVMIACFAYLIVFTVINIAKDHIIGKDDNDEKQD